MKCIDNCYNDCKFKWALSFILYYYDMNENAKEWNKKTVEKSKLEWEITELLF